MKLRYVLANAAERDLRNLAAAEMQRIIDGLDRFIEHPEAGDVVKLKGIDEYRLRIGDWRVRFSYDPVIWEAGGERYRTVVALRVLRRNEGTYRH